MEEAFFSLFGKVPPRWPCSDQKKELIFILDWRFYSIFVFENSKYLKENSNLQNEQAVP